MNYGQLRDTINGMAGMLLPAHRSISNIALATQNWHNVTSSQQAPLKIVDWPYQ